MLVLPPCPYVTEGEKEADLEEVVRAGEEIHVCAGEAEPRDHNRLAPHISPPPRAPAAGAWGTGLETVSQSGSPLPSRQSSQKYSLAISEKGFARSSFPFSFSGGRARRPRAPAPRTPPGTAPPRPPPQNCSSHTRTAPAPLPVQRLQIPGAPPPPSPRGGGPPFLLRGTPLAPEAEPASWPLLSSRCCCMCTCRGRRAEGGRGGSAAGVGCSGGWGCGI